MSELKIRKLICEIRYPPAPALVDNMGKIVTRWLERYNLTDWEIGIPYNVIIHNSDRRTLLQTNILKSAIIMELPLDYENFRNLTEDFLSTMVSTLQVKEINRIGLRVIQLAEYKNFNTLVANMRKALYNLQDDEWDILGGPPIDIAFPFTFILGENRANFNLAPVRKQKLMNIFESAPTQAILPKIALLVDFDLYKANLKIPQKDFKKFLSDFLKLGENEVLIRTKKFIDHYKGFE